MELFDKKFVHFMWEDELRGKDCIIDDNIDGLKSHVNDYSDDHTTRVIDSENTVFPFHEPDGNDWRFCYYDPNYECKRAFAEGKTIQFKNYYDIWEDLIPEYNDWNEDTEYRIKPDEPRRMTNRELARWLAKGNGQVRLRSGDIRTSLIYTKDDSYVSDGMMIRGWDEEEWHEPVIKERG